MNRKIVFRAKRVDNGEWVEGSLLTFESGKHHIMRNADAWVCACPAWCEEVIPETVCQFTGLTDKNEVPIFEGDVLHTNYHKDKDVYVKYIDGRYRMIALCDSFFYRKGEVLSACFYQEYVENLKVIGNINDNPKLLKVN